MLIYGVKNRIMSIEKKAEMKNKADYSKYECPYSHLEKECGHELKGPEGYEDVYSVWCDCGYRSPVFYLDPDQLGLKLKGDNSQPKEEQPKNQTSKGVDVDYLCGLITVKMQGSNGEIKDKELHSDLCTIIQSIPQSQTTEQKVTDSDVLQFCKRILNTYKVINSEEDYKTQFISLVESAEILHNKLTNNEQ